jgi:large subunit ribosomal protein L31
MRPVAAVRLHVRLVLLARVSPPLALAAGVPVQQLLSYRPVVFLDRAADFGFVVRSTARTDKTIVWEDGKTYPLVTLDVSSASHPFYTGQQTTLDSAGRIDRFNRRLGRSRAAKAGR